MLYRAVKSLHRNICVYEKGRGSTDDESSLPQSRIINYSHNVQQFSESRGLYKGFYNNLRGFL